MTSRKHEGFRVERRTATLDFAEDSPYHGVEATVSISMPFKTLFWFQENAGNEDSRSSAEALSRFGEDFLIAWNVCDPNGNPYEASSEGVGLVEDSGLVLALMAAWIGAVANPSDPLSATSASGPSLEDSTMNPLAELSTPLGS